MTRPYTKKKVYPVKTCPGCGYSYQGQGRTCGDPRCKNKINRLVNPPSHKLKPLNTCPSCGIRYQGNARSCGSNRCRTWLYRHPGEIRKTMVYPQKTCPICDKEYQKAGRTCGCSYCRSRFYRLLKGITRPPHISTCPSCGEQYSGYARSCKKTRCRQWVYLHPGETRKPRPQKEIQGPKIRMKKGGLPKFLKPILDDEALLKMWNVGTENREAWKKKLERDTRLPCTRSNSLHIPAVAALKINHLYNLDTPGTTIQSVAASVYGPGGPAGHMPEASELRILDEGTG